MSVAELAGAVASSSLAELAWAGPGGPRVRGVTALLRGDLPVVAFTYADERVAREVAAAAGVALALSEPRSTGAHFRACLVHGRPRLVEDPAGEVFLDELLDQELRRFPPARLLADSPILRREHWWYLPRLVVEIHPDAVSPLDQRSGARDHLLVSQEEHLDVRTAGIVEVRDDRVVLDVAGRPPASGAPSVLFGQDASFPDLERWTQWEYRGTWAADGLAVTEGPVRPGLAPNPGLLERWRRQRVFERACRRAIADRGR